MSMEAPSKTILRDLARLGIVLRQQRIRRDLSQGALAEKIGASADEIARIERGDPEISLGLLARIASEFHATDLFIFSFRTRGTHEEREADDDEMFEEIYLRPGAHG